MSYFEDGDCGQSSFGDGGESGGDEGFVPVDLLDGGVVREWAVRTLGLVNAYNRVDMGVGEVLGLIVRDVIGVGNVGGSCGVDEFALGVFKLALKMLGGKMIGGKSTTVRESGSVVSVGDWCVVRDWVLLTIGYCHIIQGEGFDHDRVERVAVDFVFDVCQGNRVGDPVYEDLDCLVRCCLEVCGRELGLLELEV